MAERIRVTSFMESGHPGPSARVTAPTHSGAPSPRLDPGQTAVTARTTRLQDNPVGPDIIAWRQSPPGSQFTRLPCALLTGAPRTRRRVAAQRADLRDGTAGDAGCPGGRRTGSVPWRLQVPVKE